MSLKSTTSFTVAAVVSALIVGQYVRVRFFESNNGNPAPMENFDIDRYGGVWYDVMVTKFGSKQLCGQYQIERVNRKDFMYRAHW